MKETMMSTSLKDKLNALPKARREAILAEADRLHAEYVAMQEPRKAEEPTQARWSDPLDTRQARVVPMDIMGKRGTI